MGLQLKRLVCDKCHKVLPVYALWRIMKWHNDSSVGSGRVTSLFEWDCDALWLCIKRIGLYSYLLTYLLVSPRVLNTLLHNVRLPAEAVCAYACRLAAKHCCIMSGGIICCCRRQAVVFSIGMIELRRTGDCAHHTNSRQTAPDWRRCGFTNDRL